MRRKFTGYRLQVTVGKLCLLVLLFFTVHCTLYTVPYASAATSTPSAKKADESTESSSLAGKLSALKQEIASKAAQIKQTVTKKIQDKAFFGTVLDIQEEKLDIQALSGKKTVLTNEYTEFSSQLSTKKAITLKDIKEEDSVAALGDIDDKSNLVAKKIIILKKIASDSAKLIWGQVQGVNSSNIVIKNKDNALKTIKTTFSTSYFLGNEEASLLDAKKGKFLVAKGQPQANGIINSSYIYFIPSTNSDKPEKKAIASPSADLKPTSSPSATPKKKS